MLVCYGMAYVQEVSVSHTTYKFAGAFLIRKHHDDNDQHLGRHSCNFLHGDHPTGHTWVARSTSVKHLPASLSQPATTTAGEGDVAATGTAVTTGTTAGEGEGGVEGGAGNGAGAGTVTLVTTGTAVTTGTTAGEGEGEGGAGTGAGTGTGTCIYRTQSHALMLACSIGRDAKGHQRHGQSSHQPKQG